VTICKCRSRQNAWRADNRRRQLVGETVSRPVDTVFKIAQS
jgi:hypothetical protein